MEAVYRPDGKQIAFVRYGDGTHNIWTIDGDGQNPKQITQFADGTQIQGLNWLPDASSLVMALFRNHKQELWVFDLHNNKWTQLTDNDVDETDPFWGPDNRLWYTSNVDGIHNVYSLDQQGVVRKHTDVVGSAYGVDVTAEGHVFYTDFTGHGFRIKALHKDKRKNEQVEYPGLPIGPEVEAQVVLDGIPPEKEILSQSRKYSAMGGQMPFNIWPVARTTDKTF